MTAKLGGCICVKVKCTGWPRDLVFTFHLARRLSVRGRTREGLGRCAGRCGTDRVRRHVGGDENRLSPARHLHGGRGGG